jgi:hypothetical protein
MRLVFAMPTKAISQHSCMWYLKSNYTRLNNYTRLLWVAAKQTCGNIKGITDTGAYLVDTHIEQLKSSTLNNYLGSLKGMHT